MHLPNLIIIGVFKAATTSLFTYLARHPEVCGSTKKEIHYFTPLVYNTGEALPELADYASYFSCPNTQEKYRLEASPAYFYGGEKVITEMAQVLPQDHKVIVILRDPTDRLVSYYKHIRSQFLIDDDFSTFLNKCMEQYQTSDQFRVGHYHNAIREGLYLEYLPIWRKHYGTNLQVVFFDDIIRQPKAVVAALCHWLNIDASYFSDEHFAVENKTITPRFQLLHKAALSIYQRAEPVLRKNSRFKTFIRDIYRSTNSSNSSMPLDAEAVSQVRNFYQPYNEKLSDFLDRPSVSWLERRAKI